MRLFMLILLVLLSAATFAAPHRLPRVRPHPALRRVPWQMIAAGGAAAGTVIAAYKISDGIESGLKQAASQSPAVFTGWMTLFQIAILAVIVCAGVKFYSWYKINISKTRKNRNEN